MPVTVLSCTLGTDAAATWTRGCWRRVGTAITDQRGDLAETFFGTRGWVERRPNDHLVAATFTSSVRLQQYVKLERTHSQYSDLRMTNKKQSIVHATRVIAMIMSTDNNRLLFTVDDVRISLNAKRLLMSAALHSVLHREAEKGTNFLLCASFWKSLLHQNAYPVAKKTSGK